MYLFLDTETTGLPRRRGAHYSDTSVWPRVVSISWATFDSRASLIRQRYSILQPNGFTIPGDAARVHGITTERAERDGRPSAEILGHLCADLKSDQAKFLIAHNVDFDRPAVLAELLRHRLELALESLPTYCTMQGTTELCRIPHWRGGYKWPTLEELHRHLFGAPITGAHNASDDVMTCAKCYFKLNEMGLLPRGEA